MNRTAAELAAMTDDEMAEHVTREAVRSALGGTMTETELDEWIALMRDKIRIQGLIDGERRENAAAYREEMPAVVRSPAAAVGWIKRRAALSVVDAKERLTAIAGMAEAALTAIYEREARP